MSSESSSGANSSSGSSSDSSSSESRTNSQGVPERMKAHLSNIQDDNAAPAHPARSILGRSRVDADEGTDIDVGIVEEGEEGESDGPVPSAAVMG